MDQCSLKKLHGKEGRHRLGKTKAVKMKLFPQWFTAPFHMSDTSWSIFSGLFLSYWTSAAQKDQCFLSDSVHG